MAEKIMHAVQYDSYGGGPSGLKHVKVPVPTPLKGEVLLKLEAISLNPVDCRMQKGVGRPFLPRKFPCIPAVDLAGEVVEVGPGVQKFKSGDKVVSILDFMYGGGLAEYAVAKENLTVLRPPEISAAEGAALPLAGLTAYQALIKDAALKLDGSDSDKNILITAGSGGVGHFAIQLAKLGKIHITASCGARNIEFVKSLGADEAIDYKSPEGAALKSPSGKKYDAVIHCAATGISWSTFQPNLGTKGKVIDLTPGPSAFCTYAVKKLTMSKQKLLPMFCVPKEENLIYLIGLLKEGKIKAVIDSKHALSEAEIAWKKCIEGHATGKIIVEP